MVFEGLKGVLNGPQSALKRHPAICSMYERNLSSSLPFEKSEGIIHCYYMAMCKAAEQNFKFVLILVDKSSMTTTVWCHKALDQATGYC